jgi:hypothetical protein
LLNSLNIEQVSYIFFFYTLERTLFVKLRMQTY